MSPSSYIHETQSQSRAFIFGLQVCKYYTTNRAIDIFEWGNSFKGKNVHQQIHFLKKSILNIFHDYISNKTIACNDKDPPWSHNEIRKMLSKKNKIFEQSVYN